MCSISHSLSPVNCEINETIVNKYIALWDTLNYPHIDAFSHMVDLIANDEQVVISVSCRDDLNVFSQALRDRQSDAMDMIDSFTQRRSGDGESSHLDLGDSGQCHSVRFANALAKSYLLQLHCPLSSVNETLHQFTNLTERSFEMLRRWMSHHFIPQLITICLPGSCSTGDVKAIVNSSVLRERLHPITFSLKEAYSNENFTYTIVKCACISLLTMIVVLNIIGTYSSDCTYLAAFNLRDNYTRLLKQPSDTKSQFISFSKFLYTLVALVIHTGVPLHAEALYFVFLPVTKTLREYRWARYIFSLNAVIVSWNFVVSAFLSSSKWLPIFKCRKVSLGQFIMVRALRTLPIMLVIMCMIILLPELPITNPLTKVFVGQMAGNCYSNGWRETLFIANYLPFDKMCLPVQWFVHSDMQFYIISFFIIRYIGRTGRVVSSLIIPSVVAISVTYYQFLRYSTLINNVFKAPEWFHSDPIRFLEIHISSEGHGFSYIIGILVGCAMANNYQWSKKFSLWCAFLSSAGWVLSLAVPYYFDSTELTGHTLTITIVLQYAAFVASCAALMFSEWSLRDYFFPALPGFVNYAFAILNRVQYPFFLVHPVVISLLAISFQHTYTSMTMLGLTFFPTQFILSFIIAVQLHVMVELPFARLLDSTKRVSEATKKK